MSTRVDHRAGRASRSPAVRVDVGDLIKGKVSMLGDAMLPAGYGMIESAEDAREAALKTSPDDRIIRVHIVWDNEVSNFPLQEVIDRMRETGAAMVTKAEEVKR